MTRDELVTRFRLLVPEAKLSVIGNSKVHLLLNEGVEETNQIAKVFKGSTDKNGSVGKQTYKLSEDFPNCAGIDKGGVWVDNDDGKAFRMIPKTREWFDDNLENWWEASNGYPQYYFVEGDDLTFNTPFDIVRNIRVWHLKKTIPMSSGSNYPWSDSSTEIVKFRPLDNSIISYAIREVQHALGKKGDYAKKDAEFQAKIRRGMRRVRRRPDFTSDHSAGITFA